MDGKYMGSYLQMGHHTENLVGETDLDNYCGIVLSPLNRLPQELIADVKKFKSIKKYDIILDPQLYYPRTEKEKISKHPYFPNDFESADLTSLKWWESINKKLINYSNKLEINCISSPVIDPNKFSDDYYHISIEISNDLKSKLNNNIRCLSTIMIDTEDIQDEESLMKIASFSSFSECDGFYIVFKNDLEPRRELNNEKEIIQILLFIKELKQLNKEIFLSFTSSDMILFKCAGVNNCATGKFFNLRRFTKSRYDEPSSGGGQLPYWFEHSLMSFLREPDIHRLKKNGFEYLLKSNYSQNYWSEKILNQFKTKPGEAWLAYAWRQYLGWFCKTENELNSNDKIDKVKQWLKEAEENWLKLEDNDFLMEEPRNDGSWLRPWRQALIRLIKS